MNTKTLAAAVIGFLLGGLLVSTVAALEDDPAPAQHPSSLHSPRSSATSALAHT